jgi:hypothetical protein
MPGPDFFERDPQEAFWCLAYPGVLRFHPLRIMENKRKRSNRVAYPLTLP